MSAASHHHRHRRHSWQAQLYGNVPRRPVEPPAAPTVAQPTVPAAAKPAFPIVLVPPVAVRANRRHLDHDGPGLGLALLLLVIVIAAAVAFMFWVAIDGGTQPTSTDATDFNHPPDFNHPLHP